jgi:FkbM family methyltransferase
MGPCSGQKCLMHGPRPREVAWGEKQLDLMTSRPVLLLREAARLMHLRRYLISKATWRKREEGLVGTLCSEVRSGDIVWDVGAYVGQFTKRLSDRVGPEGRVFSFEPNALSLVQLLEKTRDRPSVVVLPVALGGAAGSVNFLQRGALSRVASGAPPDTVSVRMATGDDLVDLGEVEPPCVLKIDVEGLELEVLHGLDRALSSPRLRVIFLEIHFRLLEERYPDRNAPAEIVALLKARGYETRWLGASHLLARRFHA